MLSKIAGKCYRTSRHNIRKSLRGCPRAHLWLTVYHSCSAENMMSAWLRTGRDGLRCKSVQTAAWLERDFYIKTGAEKSARRSLNLKLVTLNGEGRGTHLFIHQCPPCSSTQTPTHFLMITFCSDNYYVIKTVPAAFKLGIVDKHMYRKTHNRLQKSFHLQAHEFIRQCLCWAEQANMTASWQLPYTGSQLCVWDIQYILKVIQEQGVGEKTHHMNK